MVSLDEVLKKMDQIEWENVPDVNRDPGSIRLNNEKFEKFLQILSSNGYKDLGLILDLGCGTGFSSLYQNYVGLDINLSSVKGLREKNVKAIHGDLRFLQTGVGKNLRLDKNCVDSVTCFYPPVNEILEDMPDLNDFETYEMDRFYVDNEALSIPKTWDQRLVQYASGVARKYLIIHQVQEVEKIMGKHELNPEFLKFYGLHNLRQLDLGNSSKLLVMEKRLIK